MLLRLAWESVSRAVQAAQRHCTTEDVGIAALFEVNRKIASQKPAKPFDARLEPRTTERYTNLWKRVVGYIIRIRAWPEDDQPLFWLTDG